MTLMRSRWKQQASTKCVNSSFQLGYKNDGSQPYDGEGSKGINLEPLTLAAATKQRKMQTANPRGNGA